MLGGAAAVLAAGIASPARGHGAAAPIRAAAVRGGELLALTEDYQIRRLAVTDGRAQTCAPAGIDLPEDFHPHSMAALGEALWITGAVELSPDRSLPALVRADDSGADYAELPVPDEIRSGVATSIAALGESGLAVAVEGCPDPHLALVTTSRLVASGDAGATWSPHPLADGLGEGYGTRLAPAGDRLFAVVADGAGTQTVHTGPPGTAPAAGATATGAGRPMAAIWTSGGVVRVFSDLYGKVRESRYTTDGAALETAPECGCAGEVLAIPGRAGAWLEADADRISYRTERR